MDIFFLEANLTPFFLLPLPPTPPDLQSARDTAATFFRTPYPTFELRHAATRLENEKYNLSIEQIGVEWETVPAVSRGLGIAGGGGIPW